MGDARKIARGLTKAQRAGITFFDRHGPIGLFRIGEAPTRIIRKRLEKAGLIEVVGREPGRMLFTFDVYALSDLGRAVAEALREMEG